MGPFRRLQRFRPESSYFACEIWPFTIYASPSIRQCESLPDGLTPLPGVGQSRVATAALPSGKAGPREGGRARVRERPPRG